MKRFLLIPLLIVALVGAIAFYLAITTPREPAGVRLPLSSAQRQLLATVPESAEGFALIPTAAAFHRKLHDNPTARPHVERWSRSQPLPPPWVVGRSDLVAWRSGERFSYAVRLDLFRAMLLRVYLMLAGGVQGRFSGRIFVVNGGDGPRMAASEIDALLELGRALPAGQALVVQREASGGAFPPLSRPAVSSVSVTAGEIRLSSRAAQASDDSMAPAALRVRYPRSALITVAFSSPPRALGDLDRLVQARITNLLRDGGAIALYEVDSDKLLPRPREVIILPATPERRIQLRQFLDDLAPSGIREALGFRIETADTGQELLVAFEKESIERYLADTFSAPRAAGTGWSLHADPQRLAPVLGRIGDSTALRFAAPRIFRSARALERWIGELQNVRTIEAASSVRQGEEELTVVLSSQ